MEDFYEVKYAKIDTDAPEFDLPFYDPIKDNDWNISLKELKGKWIVLFYYPADFTFVCPTELKDMANEKEQFDKLGIEVLAASTDTTFSHRAWVKHEWLMKWFPYKMLSDHSLEVADLYNILDEKTGIAWRWTFIIDPDGVLRWIEVTSWPLWRNSTELLRKIEALEYMRANPSQACPARWIPGDKTLTPSIKIAWEVFEQLNK